MTMTAVKTSSSSAAATRCAGPGRGPRSAGHRWFVSMVALCALLAAPSAMAWDMLGEKALLAHPRSGAPIKLGSVIFTATADGATSFALRLDHHVMKDFFLSMREFKCLEAAAEVTCHVPYPYKHPATVSAQNLAWLEHSLLFLYKQPKEFGAKLWNGVIFKFEATPTGLRGRPQAVDLNLIASPPSDLSLPPYTAAKRDDIGPGSRWIEALTIE